VALGFYRTWGRPREYDEATHLGAYLYRYEAGPLTDEEGEGIKAVLTEAKSEPRTALDGPPARAEGKVNDPRSSSSRSTDAAAIWTLRVLGRSRGHSLCILLQQKMAGNPLSFPELKALQVRVFAMA
jgi:hypothetical protein